MAGSGLSGLLDHLQDARTASYAEVGLPAPGVHGSGGRISVGSLGGSRVALLGGRLHLYEGFPIERVVFQVRALATWGVRKLVLTSAVGSVDANIRPGSIVRITDHINLMGCNPLVGPNLDGLGERFPDLSHAYDPELGALAEQIAVERGLPLTRGVYAAMLGPSYETPAEIRMVRTLGASVVGMSTVPEVIAATHARMRVVVFSIVSNLAAGLATEPITDDEVRVVAGQIGPTLAGFLAALVARW